jgi:hypothetical protein
MVIAVVTNVTSGITTFLLNKLWKYIKAKLNEDTPDATSPPNPTPKHYTTPPSSPSDFLPV